MAVSDTAGAPARRAIRRASTTTPTSAAPPWPSTKPPRTALIWRAPATGWRCSTGITGTLRRAVYQVSLPNRVVLGVAPDQALPEGHPAHGKGLVAGRPAVFVCDGPVCSLPLTEPKALVDNLASLR